MDKVCVLMSTYNGEKYLNEQIDSILKQKNVEVTLLVRDDGSSDNTINILQEYAKNGKLSYYTGKNLKPAFSFLNLLKNAPESEYYAFSDQDDYWMEEKLEKAIEQLKKSDNYLNIYFSNVETVDKNLNHMFVGRIEKKELASSFICSPAIGCSMVINNNMRKKIIEKNLDDLNKNIMHDGWIYRVGLAIGANVIYDYNYYIKYRQHENNVIGLHKDRKLLKKIQNFFSKREKYKSYIAADILKLYNDQILAENRVILEKLSRLTTSNKLKDKINIICDKRFRSKSINKNIMFIYDIIINRG